jgi:hypothetical protein
MSGVVFQGDLWRFFWCAHCRLNVITSAFEKAADGQLYLECPKCAERMEHRFSKDDNGLLQMLRVGVKKETPII